ncbi:MAG: DUF4230 domain-containing protein [Sphingomonadales bacterium]|nr:DUF4230 domain-containing protein [Sphingomonadales bacterium]
MAIFVTGIGSITSRIFGGGPDPQTIATASLEGLREQNVLVPFSARFVAVTTSTQRPDITVSNPDIDIDAIREYDGGGVLMALTDAEGALDDANRREGQRSLIRQAQAATPMRLARDAARRAVETNFELPLRAAGIDAVVRARFAGEANANQMDRSRNIIAERRREAAEQE